MDAADLTSDMVGREVRDATGHRLGRLESLYRDVESRTVYFGAVSMIRRGRRRSVYVPLVDATLGSKSIILCCGADLARRAPQTRPGCALPVELEGDLYRHYEIPGPPPPGSAARLRRVG